MRRPLTLFALFGALAMLTGAGRTYDNSKITIVLAFSAKAYCSCLYVTEMPEAHCLAYMDVGPKAPKPRLSVSPEEKTVTASYFFFFRQKAQYQGARFGCSLLP